MAACWRWSPVPATILIRSSKVSAIRPINRCWRIRPLINRVTQAISSGFDGQTLYGAVGAPAGVITPNTTFFGAPTWTLPGTQRRYRDWLKTGHGMLNVTKAIEESADTFFYQVAFEMGIDRIHEWLSKFGYGQSTGIDLNEEYAGCRPAGSGNSGCIKAPYQGDTISVGIGRGTGSPPRSRW